MVFFKDKAGTPHTLSDPSTYLSPSSLMRRDKNNVLVSAQDLPVSPDYVERIKALGVETYFSTRWMNGLLVQCSVEKRRAIERESYVNEVEYVAPGRRLSPYVSYAIPSRGAGADPVYFSRKPENEPQLSMLGVLDMHQRGYLGDGVLIAVFDGGFDGVDRIDAFDHLFAQQRLVYTQDYVKNSGYVFGATDHGTFALSCIGAYIADVYAGTAYKAHYALFVTEDDGSEYKVEEYNWLFAAEKADSLGAAVISSSLGYSTFDDRSMNYTYDDLNGETAVSSRAAAWARQRGIMVVNSAGNSGRNSRDPWVGHPCDADSILCVGAVNEGEKRAIFSSKGPTADDRTKPDVSAMGEQTVGIISNDRRERLNGTSFSAPLISGLVACFMERYPDKTTEEIRKDILLSAHQAKTPDNLLGYGIPHFLRHTGEPIDDEEPSYRLSVYPNPIGPVDKNLHVDCISEARYTHVDFLFYLFDGALQKYLRKPLAFSEKEGRFIFPVEDIPSGVYALKVRLLSNDSETLIAPTGGNVPTILRVVYEYEPVRFIVQ